MSTRNRTAGGLVAVAAAVVILLVASRALGGVDFSVRIDDGLQPHLSPDDVKSIVVTRLDSMASAVGKRTTGSAEAIATRLDGLEDLLPDTPILDEAGWEAGSTVWAVRAYGTFVTFRGRSTEPRTAESGWFIIDDASGEIIAMGFPLQDP